MGIEFSSYEGFLVLLEMLAECRAESALKRDLVNIFVSRKNAPQVIQTAMNKCIRYAIEKCSLD